MERWKSIPGYEGVYEASNEGRIRTAYGKTTRSARFPVRHWKQRIMKQKYQHRPSGKCADAKVSLWKDGKEKTWLVSRLVALAWCVGYKEGMTVNHIDGNSLNNHADNLEWISLHENILHGFENGLYSNQVACSLVTESGKAHHFRSQSEASRFLGRRTGYVNLCIKESREAKDTKGQRYAIISV